MKYGYKSSSVSEIIVYYAMISQHIDRTLSLDNRDLANAISPLYTTNYIFWRMVNNRVSKTFLHGSLETI